MALFGRRKGGDGDGPRLGADGIPDPEAWAPRWADSVNPSLEAAGRPPLDFSMASLEVLDAMLGDLAPRRDELPDGFDLGPACYLGETLRRNHGGTYQLGPDRDSDPLVLVHQGDGFAVGAMFYHRIRQRLAEGDDANIPFYAAGYPQYIERRADATLV